MRDATLRHVITTPRVSLFSFYGDEWCKKLWHTLFVTDTTEVRHNLRSSKDLDKNRSQRAFVLKNAPRIMLYGMLPLRCKLILLVRSMSTWKRVSDEADH